MSDHRTFDWSGPARPTERRPPCRLRACRSVGSTSPTRSKATSAAKTASRIRSSSNTTRRLALSSTLFFLLVGAGSPPLFAADTPLAEGCGLLARCGLTVPESCPEALKAGLDDVRYDEDRCREPRELARYGVDPAEAMGFRIFRYLGRRYRVVYAVEGELPMSPARLELLLDDLPLAAKLLSHFQKTQYTASYVDPSTRRRFRGAKKGAIEGEAELVAGGIRERTLFYYGFGASQVAFWKLRGRNLLRFEYRAAENGLSYSMRILVAPENAVINKIMGLGLFKKVVQGHIREVIDDIQAAGAKLSLQGLGEVTPGGPWTEAERERLERFLATP